MSESPRDLVAALTRVTARQGGPMDLSALLPERMVIESREGRRLRKMLSSVSETAFASATQALAAGMGGGGKPGYRVQGGVGIIDIRGVLSKEFSLWGLLFGGQACTEYILSALNAAVADPEVKRILAVFDTPGGDVRGIDELAEAFFATRKAKPLIGLGADRCMSAGYWLASQCETLYLTSNCWAGAIGVRIVCENDERADLNAGIDRKTFGSVPAKIETPDAAMQQMADDMAANFVATIARGRGISVPEAEKLADALPYIGQRAVALGLADGITTLEALVGKMQEEVAAVPPIAVDVHLMNPCEDEDEIETGRAVAPNEQRAGAVARSAVTPKEAPMSDATPTATAGDVKALSDQVLALTEQVKALATQHTATAANVAAVSAERELDKILDQARAEVRLVGDAADPERGGNAAWLEPAIRAAFAKSQDAARVFVFGDGTEANPGLPKLGKGEGSVVAGTAKAPSAGVVAKGSTLPAKHRFDPYGPEVWSKADAPRLMQEHGRQMLWIQDQEKAGAKFKSYPEALSAYRAATATQRSAA